MPEKPKLELLENAVSDDPFDLAKLRVSQDFLETTHVKKLLTTSRFLRTSSGYIRRRNTAKSWRCLSLRKIGRFTSSI
jgi:hypothetical protein